MISGLFFTWFFAACLWTVNALRHPVPPHGRFPPLWLPGMLVSELAPLYFVLRALVAWGFLAIGGADNRVGQAAVVLFILSEIGLAVLMARTIRAAWETGLMPSVFTLPQLVERRPRGVGFVPEVHYWNGLTLDVYARPGAESSPTLIYVHPGSWMRGRPGRQARTMFYRLAERGWVILDIRYPLSPEATFPDHIVGVKRAVAWAKADGIGFGIDPERVAISGGSSGAHLAALATLTWDNRNLQPGFERADTSVIACVPFYGIYDLLVRNPTRYDWPFVARHVMKARFEERPELYRLGSPIDQVRADTPPFLVIHGELDSIVLAAESQHFVEALVETGAMARYHEVRGAQHGFDAIASLRSRAVANLCVEWLEDVARLGNGLSGRA